jgi:hypothetical protein
MIKLIAPPLIFFCITLIGKEVDGFIIPIVSEKSYANLKIKDSRFEKLLTTNPDLFQFGGVRLGKSKLGETLVLAVGYTTIINSTATDKVRQLTVTSQKAKAALVGFLEGEYVSRLTNLKEEVKVQSSSSESDRVEISSLFNESMLLKIKGKIGSGLERIAYWKSNDGLIFYQAIGFVIK